MCNGIYSMMGSDKDKPSLMTDNEREQLIDAGCWQNSTVSLAFYWMSGNEEPY
ncbi:683_t:CDS:2 [Entrophospora sp. SA101]|nr:683_t:CDS:2 [Entrophospora sp. SA101]CAJ0838158.1 16326_t:CDS:2 [Entrophospora sp. SA101]